MKIYVSKKSLYFAGSFKEILKELKELSKKNTTIKKAINTYLN